MNVKGANVRRVWLITNPASGSVKANTVSAIDEALDAIGWTCVTRSTFPNDGIPAIADLEGIDMVIVAAGDGTINAVARALDNWSGMLLVLPGGTMNMLPKVLHSATDFATIIAAAGDAPAEPMPTVESGEHRALVGVLVGPAARWVHAREAVRKGRWRRVARAASLAWTRSFGQSVRMIDGQRRSAKFRAISVSADGAGLRVIRIGAQGWTDAARLGWHWIAGDIEAAPGVNARQADAVQLAGKRPAFALFDGEPAYLPSDAVLTRGITKLKFVRTA